MKKSTKKKKKKEGKSDKKDNKAADTTINIDDNASSLKVHVYKFLFTQRRFDKLKHSSLIDYQQLMMYSCCYIVNWHSTLSMVIVYHESCYHSNVIVSHAILSTAINLGS